MRQPRKWSKLIKPEIKSTNLPLFLNPDLVCATHVTLHPHPLPHPPSTPHFQRTQNQGEIQWDRSLSLATNLQCWMKNSEWTLRLPSGFVRRQHCSPEPYSSLLLEIFCGEVVSGNGQASALLSADGTRDVGQRENDACEGRGWGWCGDAPPKPAFSATVPGHRKVHQVR
jgi:hypothetical protein